MHSYVWVGVRLQKECSNTLCATPKCGKASKTRSSMAACSLVSSSGMYFERGQLLVKQMQDSCCLRCNTHLQDRHPINVLCILAST